MSSAWRVAYLWTVNTCAVLGFIVPLALLKPADEVPRGWIPHAAVWIAFGLLTLRGVAGFIFDRGLEAYAWDSTFLAGGLLFGGVAWLARHPQNQDAPSSSGTPK